MKTLHFFHSQNSKFVYLRKSPEGVKSDLGKENLPNKDPKKEVKDSSSESRKNLAKLVKPWDLSSRIPEDAAYPAKKPSRVVKPEFIKDIFNPLNPEEEKNEEPTNRAEAIRQMAEEEEEGASNRERMKKAIERLKNSEE